MEPREHQIEFRVRYAETDAMGYAHHSNYFTWFEMGRTELFRVQGGDYRCMEEQGHFLVVASLTCRYRLPARYDDLLTLRTILAKVGPAKLEHRYELRRAGTLLTTAESVLACVNRQGQVQRLPDVLPGLFAE